MVLRRGGRIQVVMCESQTGGGAVLPGVQNASLTSAQIEGFCLRCGLGYGGKERRGTWG